MANNRIEQLIDDIIDFVDSCKTPAFSSNKVVVPKDELYDLLDELKLRTPEEIKKFQKIVNNKDIILNSAETKAAQIIAEANEKAARLVSEHEIMQQAYDQANELIRQANDEAKRISTKCKTDSEEIMNGAYTYTNDLLSMIENILSDSYKNTKAHYDNMLSTLNSSLEIVKENKKEINGNTTSEADDILDEVDEAFSEDNNDEELPSFSGFPEDDFVLDPESFINNIED